MAQESAPILGMDFSLREWNDALYHAVRAPMALSTNNARVRLMDYPDSSDEDDSDETG